MKVGKAPSFICERGIYISEVFKMKVLILTKKKIAIVLIALAVVITAAILSGKAISISTLSQNKLVPIYNVKTDEKKIAISFDAAWGNEDTQKLIDIMAKYNVKATFFVVGEWVDKYPESVKALADAGHSIQNHSDTHPHLTEISKQEVISQIENCNDKIEKLTGTRPVLLRPPYGDYNNTVIETINELKMYPIQWDVDSLDWKEYDAKTIYSKVISKVGCGSIVLFHNAALHTPEALPVIIEKLQSDGYEFVKITDLIYKDNYSINFAGTQIKNQ